jgi:hypothetical protein
MYCLVESNGRILARADRELFASFNLHIGETHYVWRSNYLVAGQPQRLHPLAYRFLLLQEDTKIGSVELFGLQSRRAAIDLPEVIPLPAQVFLFWLAAVARRQSTRTGLWGLGRQGR